MSDTDNGDSVTPSPEEVAHLLRVCKFALEHGRAAMVAFVDRTSVSAIGRDVERMGEVLKQVKAMLDRLPPEGPMSPERQKLVGSVVGAVLRKRFDGGPQEDVDRAVDAWLADGYNGGSTPCT